VLSFSINREWVLATSAISFHCSLLPSYTRLPTLDLHNKNIFPFFLRCFSLLQCKMLAAFSVYSSTLITEAVTSYVTPVNFHRITWDHIQENSYYLCNQVLALRSLTLLRSIKQDNSVINYVIRHIFHLNIKLFPSFLIILMTSRIK
jgi:hypothetical protein